MQPYVIGVAFAGAGPESLRFERTFCERVTGCLSADSTAALLELATGADGFLAELKACLCHRVVR
jgi:hypothetical protein